MRLWAKIWAKICVEFKDAAVDMRYLVSSKLSKSLVHKEKEICKQTIIKLSLAYSFWKIFFIGQTLKLVLMTYSFLELLIFFLSTLV